MIIDKKSMVGRHMLSLIDLHLRIAFLEHQDQPFSDRSIILVGDFGQLSPMFDKPMYTKNIRHDLLLNDGMKIYSLFREVYQLNIV